jgi:hypothetical protein
VLTGTARIAEIEREGSARAAHAVESERRRSALARRTASLEAQIADLQSQLAAESADFDQFAADEDAGASEGAAARAAQSRRLSGLGGRQDQPGTSPNGGSA